MTERGYVLCQGHTTHKGWIQETMSVWPPVLCQLSFRVSSIITRNDFSESEVKSHTAAALKGREWKSG